MKSTERTVTTACPLDCWDGCSLLARVEGGEVRGLLPDPGHPITRGRLCPKARFQLDLHRAPDRLREPLVRSGGRQKTASWDAALDLVAGRLLEARERYGSLSVLHYWDAGSMGLLKKLWHRLFNLFGGVTEPHGSLCWAAGIAAQQLDFGGVLAHSPLDLARTGLVVLWGRNPVDTNPHLVPHVEAARARGVTVVVIDPLRTATVRDLADVHLAPRPGTDVILALAVAGELIRRGSYDRGFCASRAKDFETFASAASGVGLADAAAWCGLAEPAIRGLADLLASRVGGQEPAAFLIGYGLQRYRLGGETIRAVDALAAVAGSIGRPGGGANYASWHADRVLEGFEAQDTVRARRYFDKPAFGRQVAAMLAPGEGSPDDGPWGGPPVQVLVCERANPVVQLPDIGRVIDTFRRIPFKVVVDVRSTDTTSLADVVLPVADALEDEDLYSTSWNPTFTWTVPAADPPERARSETSVIEGLAARLGLAEHFGLTPAQWIIRALRPLADRYPSVLPGGDMLSLRGRWFANPAAEDVPWTGAFATPSGKFQFGRNWVCLGDLARGGAAAPAACPTDGPAAAPDASFHLVTPQSRYALHSMFYEETLKRTSPLPGLAAVWVHPAAAGRLGLQAGRKVRVATATGTLVGCLVTDPGLREDTVLIYSGGSAGLVGGQTPASANVLTPDRVTDLGVQAAYYDCRCTLSPA